MVAERTRDVQITTISADVSSERDDCVAAEEPLEIRIGGRPLAVVMRTPGDDVELTAGFLKAEMIIANADDVGTIRHCKDEDNVIDVKLSPDRARSAEALLAERMAERSTVTSASCGVCGKRTIESLHAGAAPFAARTTTDPNLIAS